MKRTWIRCGVPVFLCALLVAACGDDDGDARYGDKPFFGAMPKLVHFSHRGGADLYPESTLYAFEHAINEYGTDVLEIDQVMSADGHIVVIHDVEVDRTTDGTGLVTEMTLAELKELDAAYWFDPDGDQTYPLRGTGITIPTLEETFEAFPQMYYNLEIKDDENEYEEDLYAVVQLYNMEDRVLWGSANDDCAQRLKAVAPHIAIYYPTQAGACLSMALINEDDPLEVCDDHYDAINAPDAMVSPEMVEMAHSMNVPVYVWTINEREFMETLFDYGVDGIITDRPDLLREAIDARL